MRFLHFINLLQQSTVNVTFHKHCWPNRRTISSQRRTLILDHMGLTKHVWVKTLPGAGEQTNLLTT